MSAQRCGLAGSAKVVREPVHRPGVGVAPLPVVAERLVERTMAPQAVNEHGRESFGLPERVSDALAWCGVLEVTGVAHESPTWAGRTSEEPAPLRHHTHRSDDPSAAGDRGKLRPFV